jgi:hypothetical protein
MACAGPFFVTPHAIERYRTRIRPRDRLTYREALEALTALSERAHKLMDRDNGTELWRTGRPERLRLVVGPGEWGPEGKPALLTVLGPYDDWRPRRCES